MTYNEAALGDIFTFTDEGTRWTLTLSADGLYLAQFIVSWTATFAEPSSIRLVNGIDDQNYSEGYGSVDSKVHATGSPTFGPYAAIQKLTTFIFVSQTVTNPILDPQVHQQSGSDKSFDAYSLRVIYLGAIGAEASWWFQTT